MLYSPSSKDNFRVVKNKEFWPQITREHSKTTLSTLGHSNDWLLWKRLGQGVQLEAMGLPKPVLYSPSSKDDFRVVKNKEFWRQITQEHYKTTQSTPGHSNDWLLWNSRALKRLTSVEQTSTKGSCLKKWSNLRKSPNLSEHNLYSGVVVVQCEQFKSLHVICWF